MTNNSPTNFDRSRVGQTASIAILICAVAIMLCSSQASAKAPLSTGRRIATMIQTFRTKSGADIGVSVVDLRNRETIAAFQPDKLLIPASNQKLLTSAFALASLGGDFQFVTRAYLFNGDLVIVGGDFDPTTGDSRLASQAGKSVYAEFDRIAQAVKASTKGRSIKN